MGVFYINLCPEISTELTATERRVSHWSAARIIATDLTTDGSLTYVDAVCVYGVCACVRTCARVCVCCVFCKPDTFCPVTSTPQTAGRFITTASTSHRAAGIV